TLKGHEVVFEEGCVSETAGHRAQCKTTLSCRGAAADGHRHLSTPLKQRVYTHPTIVCQCIEKLAARGSSKGSKNHSPLVKWGGARVGRGYALHALMSSPNMEAGLICSSVAADEILAAAGAHFQARFVSLQRRDSKLHLK